jgi:hypothetical protein
MDDLQYQAGYLLGVSGPEPARSARSLGASKICLWTPTPLLHGLLMGGPSTVASNQKAPNGAGDVCTTHGGLISLGFILERLSP